MAGINVQEIKRLEITTTDGQTLKEGDPIVICVKGQDIVCRFAEIDKSGYFVTVPFVAGTEPVKYRLSSITQCYKVTSFVWDNRNNAAEAGRDAAQDAAQDALAPATA